MVMNTYSHGAFWVIVTIGAKQYVLKLKMFYSVMEVNVYMDLITYFTHFFTYAIFMSIEYKLWLILIFHL